MKEETIKQLEDKFEKMKDNEIKRAIKIKLKQVKENEIVKK
jgi:hypothetical protein